MSYSDEDYYRELAYEKRLKKWSSFKRIELFSIPLIENLIKKLKWEWEDAVTEKWEDDAKECQLLLKLLKRELKKLERKNAAK